MCKKSCQIANLGGDEQGSVTALAMALCLTGIIAYVKVGHAYLLTRTSTEFHLVVIAILAVATILTLGCQIHLIFKGERSPRQIRRELRRQLKDLAQLTQSSLERLREAEDTLSWKSRMIRPIAYEHGSRAQELVARLNHRGRLVESLIQSRNKEDWLDAVEVMNAPLHAHENCQDTLIKTRPMAALLPDQWVASLEHLLQAVEFEVKRSEERIRRKESYV